MSRSSSRRIGFDYLARSALVWSLGGLLVGILLAGWAYATRGGGFSSLILPSIGEVSDEFLGLFGVDYLVAALRVTLIEIVAAFAIASTLGLAAAYLVSRSALCGDVVEPLLAWAYMFPVVLLYPIFLLCLGVGQWSTIAYAATASVIPITYNSLRGLRNVESRYLRVGRAFGAPRWTSTSSRERLACSLIRPARRVLSRPHFGDPAQLLGAHDGLGHEIKRASDTVQNARAFALVIFLIIVAALVQRVLEFFLKPIQR